jgi:hypothetical protein
MAESRYEKYVVRKPAVWTQHASYDGTQKGKAEVPDKVPVRGSYAGTTKPIGDTGGLVLWGSQVKEGAKGLIEYGIITGDCAVGDGAPGMFSPRKSYGEGFYFLIVGTNPDDLSDLGGEAELWLGEGKDLRKVEINTPTCIFNPPGEARFPLIWKNVKRPIIMFIFVPGSDKPQRPMEPADLEGRPMWKPE